MNETEHKLHVLGRIAAELNEAGVTWDIGASCALYLRGIAPVFHDIDITISAEEAPRVKAVLDAMGTRCLSDADPQYHTRVFLEYQVDGVDIDVMAGMVIVREGKEYDCSLVKEDITDHVQVDGQDIPLHSLEKWKEYYRLMGRDEKVRMIETYLHEDAQ